MSRSLVQRDLIQPNAGGRASAWVARLVARAGRIGADPGDDSDIALQKRLLVSLSLAVVPAAAL